MSPSSPSSSISPPPEELIVVGCGGVTLDFLAAVASFPKPDHKIRSTSFQVADDAQGRGLLMELEDDAVDTSFFVVAPEGNSPFTYVIVDNETKTRTCIHTPMYPPMVPEELPQSRVQSALDKARLVYFDVRLHETALVIAEEASRRGIPILIDAERKRDGLDELLSFANYVVCSAKFPQSWTEASSLAKALLSIMLRLPKLKFVIVTLGEEGCVMLERWLNKALDSAEMDIEGLLESLKQNLSDDSTTPSCVSSSVMNLKADGVGMLCGRLHVGTSEKIPPSELVDTTGAGDAFTGAVLYGTKKK